MRFLIAFAFAGLALAAAQETSVRPGVNKDFVDPNVDRYIKLFEGESRAIYKHRNEIADALGLKPGMDVVDVGAGTGFFSMMMAERIAPEGTVYAVDIAKNFVAHIKKTADEYGHKNIVASICGERSIDLPDNSVDLAFICDVYHHFEYPYDSLASIHKALRPGGSLFIIDFERIKGVSPEFAITHVRCGKGTVTDEVKDAGFDFAEEVHLMDDQYVLKFAKRETKADE